MASSVTFRLQGLDRLEAFMDKLPAKVQQNSVKKAVTFAATPMLSAVKKRVPEDHGGLKERFVKKTKLYRDTGTVVATVGVDKNKKTYYHGRKKENTSTFTSDHPTNLIWLLTFGFVHPGGHRTKPNRFMQRAVRDVEGLVATRYRQKLKRDLPKDIARLKKKGVVKL